MHMCTMFELKIYVYTILVSVLSRVAHAQVSTSQSQSEPIKSEESHNPTRIQTDQNEQLFKRLFVERRREHLEAVKSLRKVENYERRYKMIMILAEKVFYVIQSSRAVVENSGFLPGNSSFPDDVNVRDALSSILENTALFSDIILHLPDITHRILKAQQQWNTIMQWSLNFVNQTKYLLDKSTLTMLYLVGQELNVTTRDPGYFNPYRSSVVSGSANKEETPKKKKMLKREKRKREPRIIKIEL